MTKHSSFASVRATRERLEELGLSTKKSLGQHFLIDDGVVGKIIRLASLTPRTRVVEVGPGIGTLTDALLDTGVDLTSIEIDGALLQGLAERFPSLRLIAGDALAPLVVAQLQGLAPQALVSNLPYAVAATIILEYFQMLPSIKSATVMVQKEVADRIAAEPGSKEYGSYTIKLRFLARVVDQFKVSPQSFFPPPRVDSAVVRLERVAEPLEASQGSSVVQPSNKELIPTASMLADAAFFQRRKTIANSMRAYFAAHNNSDLDAVALLTSAGIDPGVRGEVLLPQDYLTLAEALRNLPTPA